MGGPSVSYVNIRVRDLIVSLTFAQDVKGAVDQRLIDQITKLAVTKVLTVYGLDRAAA